MFDPGVVARRHQQEFGEATEPERRALGGVLGDLLGRLRERAGDPPYNLMIHSPRRSRSGSQAFHWFAQIRPRSAQTAGFELASGIAINASSPEVDARILRGGLPAGHDAPWDRAAGAHAAESVPGAARG